MNPLKNMEGEDAMDPNSPLSSMNGKNPFGVDPSYFDEFPAKLHDRIGELEELKAEAPFLAALPKSNPFVVPAGYFDELPAKIQEITSSMEKSSFSLKELLLQFIRPNFVLPVLTTVFIAVAAIQLINKQVQAPQAMTADLSMEEQLYPIDEGTLIDLLSGTPENELPVEETITSYLIDTNVDETVLTIDSNTTDYEDQ
jgi:hypothetical protein